ncbi:MAG: phosphoenolpyruvate--protein phosphotransferase [Alphaproteobacteria bacterium]|nr:MAG: phosphoenolpyruvate--protein phosphotransferase [Alphaproteobacteria bacterium]
MTEGGSASRRLLRRLRDTLNETVEGQARLDRVVELIADAMGVEVCSLYLFRDSDTLELCATRGLRPESVHRIRLRLGQGLVGRVAAEKRAINTADAPSQPGFRYMPETGEEVFPAFLGVPIQRLGETLGVLVVQSREKRSFTEDEVYALEVVAMVLAEMAELGAFVGEGGGLAPHSRPVTIRGTSAQEGSAEGHVLLHEPRVVVTNPIADDPEREIGRLHAALERLRAGIDDLIAAAGVRSEEQRQVLEAYRMFASSRSWVQRMEADIASGLSAEAAVEKAQSAARARMDRVPDPYLRDRLHDLDDLSNRLLRILTGQGSRNLDEIPPDPVLVARNIGPAELLEYGRRLRGVVLEEGSVGSHAAVVARALAIPLVVHARGITAEALPGDHILVDGDEGVVHLRPDDSIAAAFRDKMAMAAEAQKAFAALRDLPAETRDGVRVSLMMNAGLMADLPSLPHCGAEGVGLFRTELQFLTRSTVPRRDELVATYERVLNAAGEKPVTFRTLDIGSDKVVPYMKREDEPNPAMGWRAIRVALDRPGILRMQLQALLRAAAGRPLLRVMFPFVAVPAEFFAAREILDQVIARERALGRSLPGRIEVGAMLETPSLAYADRSLFEAVDFVSVGGNDLKQFFFAADRENERVRRRYDTLNTGFLAFLEQVTSRCAAVGTPVSFCGEDAGRPVEAACLAAIGFRTLSMRPASIGPVKHLLRHIDLGALRGVIEQARAAGAQSVREAVIEHLAAIPGALLPIMVQGEAPPLTIWRPGKPGAPARGAPTRSARR